jgi:hypothetical protein
MTSPRLIIGLGALFGIVGAAGQLWLIQFGALASAPLRTALSMTIAILIGVIAGRWSKVGGAKTAALMGVVAGAILTMVGLTALLTDPAVVGLNPLSSAESFLMFASSIILGTVISSWLVAGVAALVAWPISLAQASEV